MCCFWHPIICGPCRQRRRPYGCGRCADIRPRCALGGTVSDCGCGEGFDRYDGSGYCCDRL